MEQIDIKIVIIGIEKIGKTCFVNRISNKATFQKLLKEYKKTIVSEFGFKVIIKNNKKFRIQIWDATWDKIVINIFSKAAYVIIFFYDSMNRQSFEKIKSLYCSGSIDKNKIFFIVRNKYDLKKQFYDNSDIISDEEVLEFADENNMILKHISNLEKYETGIDELFNEIISEYLKFIKK